MFRNVLLCYDGTAHGRRALKRGAELAILVGAQVHVLSIIRDDVMSPTVMATASGHTCLFDEEGEHRKLLDDSIAKLHARGVEATGHLAHGNIIQQIVAHAKDLAVDLIVIGNYPNSGGRRWWSGPERASLAEQVNCCILVAVNAEEG